MCVFVCLSMCHCTVTVKKGYGRIMEQYVMCIFSVQRIKRLCISVFGDENNVYKDFLLNISMFSSWMNPLFTVFHQKRKMRTYREIFLPYTSLLVRKTDSRKSTAVQKQRRTYWSIKSILPIQYPKHTQTKQFRRFAVQCTTKVRTDTARLPPFFLLGVASAAQII